MSHSGSYGLMPCTVLGEPSAAIVMGRAVEDGVEIMPLFVALTPTMNLKMPRQRGGSDGRAPVREDVGREFSVNAASLSRD